MTLRIIDPAPLRARYTGPASKPGDRPELQWLKISRLRVDPRYQREIGERGQRNIVKIAILFSWSKFTPVVVASIGSNLFAIVDGQHRTTAAALRGFESVPCVIIAASEAEQADAFVAINANVTAMSTLQLHAARLAAGDKAATGLAEVCKAAGVAICRYPVPANKMAPGETLAVGMLQGAQEKYGRDILIAALSCITQTRKGNVGMIRSQIVEALCTALTADWASDLKRLIFAMQSFDFAARFNAARAASIDSGKKVATILASMIGEHLDEQFAVSAKNSVASPQPAKPAPQEERTAPPPAAKSAPVRAGMLSIGRDTVSFRGQVRVSPRGALLVAALAKAKPSFVGDAFLISRIWNVRPPNAGELMDALVSDLACLKGIGLEVRTQRGIGRQLVELPA